MGIWTAKITYSVKYNIYLLLIEFIAAFKFTFRILEIFHWVLFNAGGGCFASKLNVTAITFAHMWCVFHLLSILNFSRWRFYICIACCQHLLHSVCMQFYFELSRWHSACLYPFQAIGRLLFCSYFHFVVNAIFKWRQQFETHICMSWTYQFIQGDLKVFLEN